MQQPSAEMRDRLMDWSVLPTGPVQVTATSELMAGSRDGRPVMLKIARVEEEARGGALLAWWHGRGAVAVLEHDDRAILMERAVDGRNLTRMAATGQDAAATEILVRTALTLHENPVPAERDGVPLVPLQHWFRELLHDDDGRDPLLRRAADLARRRLATTDTVDVVVLHGDIHHGNVLDLGRPGGDRWAAIDPKGLIGHRAFDFVNICCNPDEASAVVNLETRLAAIGRLAGLAPDVLIDWTIAWCGLSLVWESDRNSPSWHARTARAVMERLMGGTTGRAVEG
jgi:streptomycin 6-kinase